MKLTEKQIAGIAEWLDCRMTFYIHQLTGEMEWYPDQEDPFFEPEAWQEVIEKIENDRGT